MREIRFRAWDTLKELMYDDTFAITESGEIIVIEQNSIWDNPDYIFAKNLVLMLYTGLEDVNGIEIYEGDVVEIPIETASDCWTVEYEEGSYVLFNQLNTNVLMTDLPLVPDKNNVYTYDIKVVGNIYENKELLK